MVIKESTLVSQEEKSVTIKFLSASKVRKFYRFDHIPPLIESDAKMVFVIGGAEYKPARRKIGRRSVALLLIIVTLIVPRSMSMLVVMVMMKL